MTLSSIEIDFPHFLAGERATSAFELHSKRRPNDPPTYWVTSFQTAGHVAGLRD
jgi:hypothetical protein